MMSNFSTDNVNINGMAAWYYAYLVLYLYEIRIIIIIIIIALQINVFLVWFYELIKVLDTCVFIHLSYLIVVGGLCVAGIPGIMLLGGLLPTGGVMANWSWVKDQTKSDLKTPMSDRFGKQFSLPRIG